MNEVILKGTIKNIQYSHEIEGVEYYKANLIVPRPEKDEDDIINIKFKRFSNPYKEEDLVELKGNLRTHSYQLPNGKNKVDVYVFTYMDLPDNIEDLSNFVELDGRICKIETLQTTASGKQFIRCILANNIITGKKKFNVYIPCIVYGREAAKFSNLAVNDRVKCTGELHSHTYKKVVGDAVEFKVAHDVTITKFEVI